MEYVEGQSGAQLLQTKGRLGADATVEIGVQACAGLEYAHRQGIIHRDVKPGNLMVIGGPAGRRRRDSSAHEPPTGEMTVKLTDFGIARAAEQTRLTQVGSVVGTAAYLAPEQARGEEATPAADVYALGVVALPAAHRAPALGGLDASPSSRSGARTSSPLPPTSLRPRRPRDALAGGPAGARGRGRRPATRSPATSRGRSTPASRPGAAAAVRRAPTNVLADRRDDRGDPADVEPASRAPRSPPSPSRAAAPAARAAGGAPGHAPPRSRAERSAGSRFARALGILLLIAILAAVIAGAVLLLTDAGQRHRRRRRRSRTTSNDQIQSIEDFVRENTQ